MTRRPDPPRRFGSPQPRQVPPRRQPAARPPAGRPAVRRSAAGRNRRPMRLGALSGRLRLGFAAVCTLLLVIGGRLVQLQGLDHAKYASAAAAQRVDTVALHALRGAIVDRNGTVLAYTSHAQDITADPQQVPAAKRAAYAAKLAPLLDRPAPDLEALLARPGQYAVLASALSPVAAQRVTDLGLTGIYTQATTQRQYPGRTTAANIIGTVHSDGTGAAGIEAEFNALLAGHDGSITYSVDNLGNVNPASKTVTDPARNGATIALTIDQSLQFVVQRYLDRAVAESG
ncbi:MAG: penicillin-binding protein 2, partial [Jatrophihabitans sp.]